MGAILTLLACTSLNTPDGEERVRGALWIDDVLVNVPGAVLVVVANSPLPCEATETEDAADTEVDEAASAESWWLAQLQSAITREGAVFVALWLGGNAAEGGEFDVKADGWLTTKAGFGGAAARRVNEAELVDRNGSVFLYQATDFTQAFDLTGSASAEVGETHAEVQFDLGPWSGTAEAERCVNPAIATAILDQVGEEQTLIVD